MKAIFGLGNIGEKYKETRHNVGFLFIDHLVRTSENSDNIEFKNDEKLNSLIVKIRIYNEDLLLVKPTTLMNLSGIAVSKVLSFYKIPLHDSVVIFDDIDLLLGEVRYREKGSAGTHNGIKSIIKELGSQEFQRIKIGIESRGVTSPSQQEISSFVLDKFNKEELVVLKNSFELATAKLKDILKKA